jgi:hypothetical protein
MTAHPAPRTGGARKWDTPGESRDGAGHAAASEDTHEEPTITALDHFLGEAAFPYLKSAGFRRKGRELALPRPGGGWGVVVFHPDHQSERTGFGLAYGMVGPSRMAWWEDRGVYWASWPPESLALLRVQAFTPDPLQHGGTPESQPYRWALGPDGDDHELAEQLGATLRNEVVTNLEAWFDPVTFADALAEKRPNWRRLLHPLPRAVAMALLDAGPSERLSRALEEIPEDDDVRQWMQARLASRPAD